MNYETSLSLLDSSISITSPTYFIADIAANHDGDLERAKDLIYKAKEAGADAAKFQHFIAEKIVSDRGFSALGSNLGHQKSWRGSVFSIYKKYECPRQWTQTLVDTCKDAGIHFMTAPYDLEAIELLDEVLPAYKIGSGDITWLEALRKIASKGKPVFLATGASEMFEVEQAVEAILGYNRQIVLMQCNTNYSGNRDNFRFVNLNVLKTFASKWPQMPLGLSDHTPGHAAVLGAIAMGARVVEKHFTDDNNRIGPDHSFALNPVTWREMVDRSRELEMALGDGIKRVEDNEQQTVVLQRRCLRLKTDTSAGTRLTKNDVEALRPAPAGSLSPYKLNDVIGKTLSVNKKQGEELYPADFQ
jgi:N-acetylneuraminate synthase